MSQFIDVHTFDHKLTGKFEIKEIPLLSIGKINQVKEKISDTAKQMLTAILNQNNENFDNTNNVNAKDVLICILDKIDVNETSIIKLFDEQLCDTHALGQCPQGRATRLLQIWEGLKN